MLSQVTWQEQKLNTLKQILKCLYNLKKVHTEQTNKKQAATLKQIHRQWLFMLRSLFKRLLH